MEKKLRTINQARRAYRASFAKLDMEAAHDSLFELMWYSQLPCFDVEHHTSTKNNQRSDSSSK